MKYIFLFLVLSFSMTQADLRLQIPLEIKTNGQLPDDSIVFVDVDKPVTPETPDEENDCEFDISGTMFAEIIGMGDIVQIRFHKGQQIGNGTRGKAMFAVE